MFHELRVFIASACLGAAAEVSRKLYAEEHDRLTAKASYHILARTLALILATSYLAYKIIST